LSIVTVMDYITIDPGFVLECSEYTTSPHFILLGALVILFAGLYVSYHLAKSPFIAFKDGYDKEKIQSGSTNAKIVLIQQILNSWWPLSILLTLVVFSALFAYNAVNIILSIINSGCL